MGYGKPLTLTAACVVAGALAAHADTNTWTAAGDGTNWSDTANWDPQGSPAGTECSEWARW
jgi:hypothetical protein